MRSKTMRKVGISLLCSLPYLALVGCPRPTALKVDEIDYSTAESAAAIVVGDPQVYARPSLINDRRREADYLQQLLANSAVDSSGKSSVKFSPQIVRDLKTVEALSASLGLSIGKVTSDTSTAADLTQQIQATKLQAQLAVLQKQVEGIQTAAAPQVTIPPPDLSSNSLAAGQSSANSTVTMPDVSALQTAIKNIQAQLTNLASVSGPNAPSNNYDSLTDPRNDFTDRQAYRRDIRAALAEAQLDDVHDRGGNQLYRLQFQATVLPPGNAVRQWGAAKMQIGPPALLATDIEITYYEWLGYISRKLSTAPDPAQGQAPLYYEFNRYIAELGRQRFFNVIDIFRDTSGKNFYCLDHRTGEDAQLSAINNPDDQLRKQLGSRIKVGTYAVPPDFIELDQCQSYPVPGAPYVFGKPLDEIRAKAAISWVGQSGAPQRAGPNAALSFKGITRESFSQGGRVYKRIEYVPEVFCRKIVDQGDASNACVNLSAYSGAVSAAGGKPVDPSGKEGAAAYERAYVVRSYSVLPTELAQRIGVNAEASQSFQTALSVAAQVSKAAAAAVDTGYLSQSDTRAQAVARQPLVVGFSGADITQPAATRGVGQGYFGWLFGPEFSIKGSDTLALRQSVRNYGVSADVSVPGWWPYLTIEISTAWIQGWRVGSVIPPGAKVRKSVGLPISNATYDSLTNFIAAQQWGPQNSRIFANYVTPTLIPACSSSVTYQIGGPNIWRADSAYLAGVKAKTVNVLPNMTGIAAEFDMNAVYGALANTDSTVQPVPLMVSAEEDTPRPLTVWIVGKRQAANGVTVCQSPFLLPAQVEAVPATIVSFSPAEICPDVKVVPLVIQGVNLPDKVKMHSAHFLPSTNWDGDWLHREVNLRLEKGVKLTPGGLLPIALTYGEPGDVFKGSLSLSISVKNCATGSSSAGKDQSAKNRGKATLVTETVKIAKDQAITVKTAVPEAYSSIAVSVRPQTKAGNAKVDWKDSSSVKAAVGDAAEVTGTIDLSALNAKVGDKLEVEVKIQARPGSQPLEIPADKTLMVSRP
jgi:hypothetical protein